MTSIYDIHEAARDCDVEGLRRCLTPPFVRCPSTAVVTATGRHAKVLQHQSPDLLYVELDGNENAEGPAFERKTIRSSDVTVLAANPVDFRQSVGGCTALHALCGFNSSRAAMAVLRAGAEISSHIRYALDAFAGPHSNTDADGEAIFLYFQKVIDAGGFKKYEQAHLAALTATFAPKLRLPTRPARLVAEYWGHAGYY